MKSLKIPLPLVLLALITSAVFAQQPGHQHTKHLDRLIDAYLATHQALASDDLYTAKIHLSAFKSEVTGSAEMNHHEEHAEMHAAHHGSMVDAVNRASEAESIDAFRAAFSAITGNLVKAVKNQDYTGRDLYLQYCPMALGGEGGSWISDREKISNPYLGSKMPNCGVRKEVLSDQGK